MFIKKFFLHDILKHKKITEVYFDKLNVLVGTSGAGKTTIMNGLNTVIQIANGMSSARDCWEFEFIDNDGRAVNWQGEFSSKSELNSDKVEVAELLKEQLTVDGQLLINKLNGKTTYKGNKLPVLDKHQSNIFLLREDDSIADIYNSLSSMIIVLSHSRLHTDTEEFVYSTGGMLQTVKRLASRFAVHNIQELHKRIPSINCRWRLFFAENMDKESFESLAFVYSTIFPNVKSIRLSSVEQSESHGVDLIVLYISLELIDGTVIPQSEISSGMFKTLMLLSDLMLSSDNTVLLIDELENSLGVNCLPDIIQEIKSANFQCIVSTHHPKIINDIPVKHWKIVNRKGNEIHVDDATDLEKSSSHHDKFIQLINSSIYKNGNG